jgi:hypothetical protein
MLGLLSHVMIGVGKLTNLVIVQILQIANKSDYVAKITGATILKQKMVLKQCIQKDRSGL